MDPRPTGSYWTTDDVHPYFTHPAVLFIWTAGWSTAALFAWLTLSNALSIRGRQSDPGRVYVWFTALSCAQALSIGLSLVPTSLQVKVGLFQLMWAVGTAALSFWVRAVGQFCRSTSRPVLWISRALLFVSAAAAADVILTPTTGTSLMFAPDSARPASLTMQATGMAVTVSPLGGFLGGASILLVLTACVALVGRTAPLTGFYGASARSARGPERALLG